MSTNVFVFLSMWAFVFMGMYVFVFMRRFVFVFVSKYVFVFVSIFIWPQLPHTVVGQGSHMARLGHHTW